MMTESPRAIVVASDTGSHLAPRQERAEILSVALEKRFGFQVERVPAKSNRGQASLGDTSYSRPVPFLGARQFLAKGLLDIYEPSAVWGLRGWQPRASGALLIGYPFSPLYHAAKRLARAGIPYVLDVGDPWVLTADRFLDSWLTIKRARRAERYLWRNSAGGIVTTKPQRDRLRTIFPDLPFLCRPSGYHEASLDVAPRTPSSNVLRLVHYGTVYAARLSLSAWLSRLRLESGVSGLHFVNYGEDFGSSLTSDDPTVTFELREPVEWEDARRTSVEFDGAIVIGNQNPTLLPSKAIKYLTLPIPRIALTANREDDVLAEFATSRPGYALAFTDSERPLVDVIAHLRRHWTREELSPPAADSWREVEREIIEFSIRCWRTG